MKLTVTPTALSELLLLEPTVFEDERGYFFESFNTREFKEVTGLSREFVQDNQSRSARNVLRGLHYQTVKPQGKLVRVLQGEIFDVAVDVRAASATFGKWVGVRLSAENRKQLWLPEGFAHGFIVLSEYADVLYKSTEYYEPDLQRSIAWNDPMIGIEWPLTGVPILSEKDRLAVSLSATVF
ncbi:dTDP-4-dehydrorhamnose 3,5-epimerase [Ralstonia sp. NFACC01]|jgi:dTDP-4-dehydrorhamnose 3,5-epimerase|uniref:dTDP-4-dehydrorhamnose 3,5-epimerase n=1 Tax=Ralstonia sp. NFACC01 TaxID=1566294 RepID=UPI000B86A1FC|nr:dTDP-4-dehydrorhamnose 3,5-epimerase [Ralstonia sp. NFACC01]